ncbi:LOW QUALITY PROTEIN: hypothetical protein Cgig2_030325 [Carnegiea gigantea]|uniref:Uncharacterized protein n=1 Tax=Carnegiea gigantea TaxID=171969 RepID=A0A9Q1JJN1_9CARY|nr:LOW QUALITY PROTEIN: hypothetical protein Cgig2_030325 [Carnegiea gigantea]
MYGKPFANFGVHEPILFTMRQMKLRIGGLPVLGAVYEEFLAPNKDRADDNKYPATVVELLRIHAELCKFHNFGHSYYIIWLDHFYREYLVYFAYGEQTTSEKGKAEAKKRSPIRIYHQERMENLNVTAEVESLCFTLWQGSYKTRNLCNGCANGFWAMNFFGSDSSGLYIPCLRRGAELFSHLYRCLFDSNYCSDFSSLVCYAGFLGSKLSLPLARHIFWDVRYVSLRASSYREDSHNNVIDMGLPNGDLKFLLSIQSSIRHVHVGSELLLEPYYPNRFARQFEFDQGVPSNWLSFIRAL